MKNIVLLVLTAFISFSGYSQKVELALNLRKGNTYYQSSVTKMDIHQEVQGQNIDIKSTITCTVSFMVIDANDSPYTLQTKYDSLSLFMEMPGGRPGLNSSDSSDFSKIMATITRFAFTVYMYKTGRIKRISSLEENIDKIINGTVIPEEQKAPLKAQLLQSFGEKAFKGSFETITHIFPAREVGVGEVWEVNTQMESMMSGKRVTEYALKESTKDHYLIEGNSVTSTEDKDTHMPVGGMNMNIC
jgi:hypothetical protein